MMLATNICLAKSPVSCKDVIKAADKVLEEKNKEITLADLAIKVTKDDNERLNKLVEEKDHKLSSIWRNPWVLIGLGVLAGTIIKSR